MKKINFITILILSVFLFSCQNTHYGNKRIKNESMRDKIKTGENITSLELAFGVPQKIYNSGGLKTYEYQYHNLSLSSLYFIPIVSTFYYGFGQNPFSTSRTARTNVEHDYLIVTADKKGLIKSKDYYSETSTAEVFETPCSRNASGITSCVPSINQTFDY